MNVTTFCIVLIDRYCCSKCKKAYARQTGVKSHEAMCDGTHIVCGIDDCDVSYSVEDDKSDANMRKHKQRVHSGRQENKKSSSQSKESSNATK